MNDDVATSADKFEKEQRARDETGTSFAEVKNRVRSGSPDGEVFLGLFHHQNQHASICFLHQQRDLVELQIVIVA